MAAVKNICRTNTGKTWTHSVCGSLNVVVREEWFKMYAFIYATLML